MISEELQDQAALYAIGALDASEASAFEAELRANSELRELVQDLRETIGALAYSAPQVEAPAEVKQRVLNEISSEKVGRLTESRKTGGVSWLPWAIAALLLLGAGWLYYNQEELRNRLAQQSNQLAQQGDRMAQQENELAQQRTEFEQQSKELAQQRTNLARERAANRLTKATVVALAPTPQGAAKSKAVVAWDGERQSGIIRISDLPAPAAGKDYQLWAVDADHKDPVSLGIVRVDAQGVARVEFRPVDPTRKVKAFAISIERAGGSAKKEGPIILLGAV